MFQPVSLITNCSCPPSFKSTIWGGKNSTMSLISIIWLIISTPRLSRAKKKNQTNLTNVWAHALNLCTNCLIPPLKCEACRACENDMHQGQGFIFSLFWSGKGGKRLRFPWSLPHYPPSPRVQSRVKNTFLTPIQSQMVSEWDNLSNLYGFIVSISVSVTEIIIDDVRYITGHPGCCCFQFSWVFFVFLPDGKSIFRDRKIKLRTWVKHDSQALIQPWSIMHLINHYLIKGQVSGGRCSREITPPIDIMQVRFCALCLQDLFNWFNI